MIFIKEESDLVLIKDTDHRLVLETRFHQLNSFYEYDPEQHGFLVYFEKGDDLFGDNIEAKLSKKEDGIYFRLFSDTPLWENVDFFEDENLFGILMLMTDNYGMEYFLPNADWVPATLLEDLYERASIK